MTGEAIFGSFVKFFLICVLVLGLLYLGLRRLRKRSFAPKNNAAARIRASVFLGDWFDASGMDESSEFMARRKLDEFFADKGSSLAIQPDNGDVKNFMDIFGLSPEDCISSIDEDQIKKFLASEIPPETIPLKYVFDMLKGKCAKSRDTGCPASFGEIRSFLLKQLGKETE